MMAVCRFVLEGDLLRYLRSQVRRGLPPCIIHGVEFVWKL